MALLCNDVSHWLGASLESALRSYLEDGFEPILDGSSTGEGVGGWVVVLKNALELLNLRALIKGVKNNYDLLNLKAQKMSTLFKETFLSRCFVWNFKGSL